MPKTTTIRLLALTAVVALISGALFAQNNEPKFDIADVHSSPKSSNLNPFMTGGVLRGGRYDLRKATMVDLIRTAYGVDAETVQGGPNWLEMDRFDIAAKAPQSTSSENVRLMLQSLLAERFKLVIHKDTKPMPAYVLKVGAGKPKMKEASGAGVAGCQPVPQKSEPGVVSPGVVTCHNISMADFAKTLRGLAGDYLTSPVIDATNLPGAWDFDLKWNFRGQIAQIGSDAVTIFDAVDKQLGLKLDLAKAPAPVLFVESVSETPTENPPGVAQALPPTPLGEFEVADIKLSPPDEQVMGRIQPGGRIELRAFTLKQLIGIAWNINPAAASELMVGATKGLDETKFNLLAKTASITTTGAANTPQMDLDDLQLMLQALLADRFGLKTHREERSIPAYTLIAVKPKLTKADPANRTGCKEGAQVAKDPRDVDPTRSRLLTCLNMTMTQFAGELQRWANGYIYSPVLDSTGIEGNYDITLSFSPIQFFMNSGRGGPAPSGAQGGGAPSAADPSGGLTLMDAVRDQLGLKLEKQKRPVSVLVIDHVEEKPTDN